MMLKAEIEDSVFLNLCFRYLGNYPKLFYFFTEVSGGSSQ